MEDWCEERRKDTFKPKAAEERNSTAPPDLAMMRDWETLQETSFIRSYLVQTGLSSSCVGISGPPPRAEDLWDVIHRGPAVWEL